MNDIITRVAAAAGLDEGVATKAVGFILNFLKKEGPADSVGQMISAFPGGDQLVADAQANTGMFTMPGIMGLGTQLMGAGLSMPQMQSVGKEMFAIAAEKAGPEAVGKIVSNVPGLSQFV